MFMSQCNRVGRASIFYYLCNLYAFPRPIRILKNMLAFRPDKPSDYRFDLISVLSMYVSSKKFSYLNLIRVITPRLLSTRNKMKDIILNCNPDYLSSILSALVHSLIPNLRNDQVLNKVFRNDLPWHISTISNQLIRTVTAQKSSESLIERLAWELTDLLLPEIKPENRMVA